MLTFNYQKAQKEKWLAFLDKYQKDRPRPDRNLDQFFATPETVLKRATLLGAFSRLAEKKLLFLGDDDLTSLAFCLFYRAAAVTVVDIDRRFLTFIGEIAARENFTIKVEEHDLRNPLAKKQFRDYDLIFFDPPYTPAAARVWLTRALEASLGRGRNPKRKQPDFLAEKFYLMCYGYTDRSPERGLKIQTIITQLGLVIQEKSRGFNFYDRAQSINSASDLYLLQPTPKVKIKSLDSARSQFYTGQKIKV